jgi:hypothetical protein
MTSQKFCSVSGGNLIKHIFFHSGEGRALPKSGLHSVISAHTLTLVWTPCLMHRCVCVFDNTYYKITTTNYISKTSLYTTFRWASGCCRRVVKAAKALPCCAMSPRICSCMASSIVWRIYVGFVADIDIKILGVPASGQACLS